MADLGCNIFMNLAGMGWTGLGLAEPVLIQHNDNNIINFY